MPYNVCGYQKASCGNGFSPSTLLIPRVESRGWTQQAPLPSEPYCQPMTLILNSSLLFWTLYIYILYILATTFGFGGYIMGISNSIIFPSPKRASISYSLLWLMQFYWSFRRKSLVLPFSNSKSNLSTSSMIIVYFLPSSLHLPSLTLSLDSCISFLLLLVLICCATSPTCSQNNFIFTFYKVST